VKNRQLAAGDRPEPVARVLGEELVVAEADRLVANSPTEAGELIDLYGASVGRVTVVAPGVDLDRFTPACLGRESAVRTAARRHLGLPERGHVIAFVGRIQPLKAPDVLLRAVARLPAPVTEQLTVAVVGGNSGTGLDLTALARSLGIADRVRFLPPQSRTELPHLFRAADLVAVPSFNESFGLVALEAQACGTPVVAAAVGGLVTAVRDGISGVLVDGHSPDAWARVLADLLAEPARRAKLSRGAIAHAQHFSWNQTAAQLLDVYGEVMSEQRRIATELAAAR
jgi:D-inositol-3-phosphate glycosyltransferase